MVEDWVVCGPREHVGEQVGLEVKVRETSGGHLPTQLVQVCLKLCKA